MTTIWNRLDQFLGVQSDDTPDFVMNCRLIAGIALILICTATTLSIFGLITEGLAPKRVLGPILIAFSVASIMILKRTHEIRIPAIMVTGGACIINGLYVYTSGGLDGYAMPVMGAIPMFVALLFGARQALFVSATIIAYVWFLFSIAPPMDHDHSLVAMAVIYSFVFLAVGILATLFAEINRQLRADFVQARDEAIQHAGAKSDFLANMSHEIRTPLNGVMGMAQLLKRTELPGEATEYADIIYSSSFSLLTIINDILDFSKIEAGKLSLDPQPCSLRTTLRDVGALMKPAAEEKGLSFLIHYPKDAPEHVIADAGRLRQIVLNLAGNAIKFTRKGRVVIRTDIVEEDGQANLTLQIVDTGVGISPDRLDAIFEQFSQADNSTTRQFGGTGLGLSISKSLVEAMGGTIAVQSKPDVGTAFTVKLTLPMSTPDMLVNGQVQNQGNAIAAT